MVTPEMSVNGDLLELMEIRYLVSPKQNPSAVQPAVNLPDCVCARDIRVTPAVLEDLVPLAHLERRDQR